MSILISSIANLCLKEMKRFTPEAIILSTIIKNEWHSRSTAFLDAMFKEAFDFDNNIFNLPRAQLVMDRFKDEFGDSFVSAVEPAILKYSSLVFSDSLANTARIFRIGNVSSKVSVVERLAAVTGSAKHNVSRTVNRWFKETQGMYFARFIMPYTERLASIRSVEGRKATLYDIGQKYKRYVEADGYWNSITDFNMATASVFAQVEAAFALGYQGLRFEAQMTRTTCVVCENLDGTEWPVTQGRAQMYDMLIMGAEEAAEVFPWPREADIKGGAQPKRLPPLHLNCGCVVQPITIPSKSGMGPKGIRDLKENVLGIMGAGNTRVMRYADTCVSKSGKAVDADCVMREMGFLQKMQRKYEGEQLIRGILGTTALKFISSKSSAPVDLVTTYNAIDVHTLTSSGPFRRGDPAARSKYADKNNLSPWTMVLVEGEPLSYDIYVYNGFDISDTDGMAHLGSAGRKDGNNEIDEATEDYILNYIGEKG